VVIWIAIGGFVVLLGLLDLTDYLLARAGRRSVLHRRPKQVRLADARDAEAEAQASAYLQPGG